MDYDAKKKNTSLSTIRRTFNGRVLPFSILCPYFNQLRMGKNSYFLIISKLYGQLSGLYFSVPGVQFKRNWAWLLWILAS